MSAGLLAIALACVVLVAGGCGGDDTATTSAAVSTTSTGTPGATGAGGAPGPASVDDVDACLHGAGFEATPDDSSLIGVKAPYERLDVPQGDLTGAAVILVFATEQDARAEQGNVGAAAGLVDVKAAGNVVLGFDSAADFSSADELVIKGCLPAG